MSIQITNSADVLAIEAKGLENLGLADNVYELIVQAAARHSNKIAINGLQRGTADEEPQQISYEELLSKINQTANLLHELGVGAEDTVSLMMPISIETNICLWAAEAAGIANPINSFLEVEHLAGILQAANTKVLIACHPSISPDPWPKAMALRELLPELRAVIQVGGDGGDLPEGCLSWANAIAEQPGEQLISDRTIRPDDIAAYFHTGGTTGVPKLARHSHRAQVLHAWNMVRFLEQDPDGHTLVGVPMFHVGGTTCAALPAFTLGTTMTLLGAEGFRNPEAVRDTMRNAERFGATAVGAVPAIWSALINIPADNLDLSKVRYGVVGAAPLSVEVVHAVTEKFGINLIEGWGMTEVHGFGSMNPLKGTAKIGSVGIRMPFLELRIAEVDQDRKVRRSCNTDEIGSVLVRGPQVIDGYVEEAHNQGAWVDGDWLDTGDLGRLDADGYLWLTGRAKDVIIRGGHNIDPILVEEVLYQHDSVELAAAVGRPDLRVGEIPVAFVQMRADAAFDEDELKAFVRDRVAERAANPVEIIAMAELPLTAVGKIFKPALRMAAAERTFQRELAAAVAEIGANVEVGVSPHRQYGSIARIEISANNTDQAQAAEKICNERMIPHSMRHEIVLI